MSQLIDLGQTPAADAPKTVPSEFAVLVDTREQQPYTFRGLRANADRGHAEIRVPIERVTLDVGDYSCHGLANLVTIERKSKADLWGSIAQRRENFEQRLRRMCCEFTVAFVVVEAEWASVVLDPPPHTRFSPTALARTIFAWMVRWPRVHWVFMPDRASAEAATYRILERCHWAFAQGKWFDAQSGAWAEWERSGFRGLSDPATDPVAKAIDRP